MSVLVNLSGVRLLINKMDFPIRGYKIQDCYKDHIMHGKHWVQGWKTSADDQSSLGCLGKFYVAGGSTAPSMLWDNVVLVRLLNHVQLFVTPGLQHTRLLCPPLPPAVWSDSCPLSQWHYPNISSSVALFSCPQSFPAQGHFQGVGSLHQVVNILELQLQHQSFQRRFRVDSIFNQNCQFVFYPD